MKVTLLVKPAIHAEVDLCTTGDAPSSPQRQPGGLEHEVAQALVEVAHQTCPYSKATRGNIDVVINLV